jgi:protein TonB
MDLKKEPAHDVHRYRPALFAASLVVSITVVTILFEWSVQVIERKPPVEDETIFWFPIPEYFSKPIKVEQSERPKVIDPTKIVEVKEEPSTNTNEGNFSSEDAVNSDSGYVNIESIEMPVEPIVEDTFRVVERMPEPEGGLEGFYKLLRKNLRYPSRAQRNNTQGKVFVEFTVSKTGEVKNVKLIKGIGDDCDREAMRVIALSKWQPGKQRGVPVNVRMVQLINFELRR